MSTRRETIEPGFEAHVALPEAGSGPGMLLLHEIFGVNDYIEDVARRLAELGYVVLAPDLYWRTEPGLKLGHDELQRAFVAAGKLDHGADRFIARERVDAVAAMAADHRLTECHVHKGAGHGFDNNFAPAFHDPEAAARAWELTSAFLARRRPMPGAGTRR